MEWIAALLVLLVVVALYAWTRGRGMSGLYAKAHLEQILRALPKLKTDALSSIGQSPPVARILTAAPMLIAYSIVEDGDAFVHHISLSTPVTPARATGTFFLALLEATLRPGEGERRAFVTQRHVFHLVHRLSAEAHQSYAESSVRTGELQEILKDVPRIQQSLLASLEQQVVPVAGA